MWGKQKFYSLQTLFLLHMYTLNKINMNLCSVPYLMEKSCHKTFSLCHNYSHMFLLVSLYPCSSVKSYFYIIFLPILKQTNTTKNVEWLAYEVQKSLPQMANDRQGEHTMTTC